jgi:hypothetical protein
MIGIRVEVTGKELCSAGIDHPGVMTSILTIQRREREANPEITLNIGGLIVENKAQVFLDWVKTSIGPGDEVHLSVAELTTVDPPVRSSDDPDFVKRQKEKYFERLKKELGK